MMIYYKYKSLHIYFSKNLQTFYELLFTRRNSEWPHLWIFFTIDLFSLIDVEGGSSYHNRPPC